jgi:hypothetical protein
LKVLFQLCCCKTTSDVNELRVTHGGAPASFSTDNNSGRLLDGTRALPLAGAHGSETKTPHNQQPHSPVWQLSNQIHPSPPSSKLSVSSLHNTTARHDGGLPALTPACPPSPSQLSTVDYCPPHAYTPPSLLSSATSTWRSSNMSTSAVPAAAISPPLHASPGGARKVHRSLFEE